MNTTKVLSYETTSLSYSPRQVRTKELTINYIILLFMKEKIFQQKEFSLSNDILQILKSTLLTYFKDIYDILDNDLNISSFIQPSQPSQQMTEAMDKFIKHVKQLLSRLKDIIDSKINKFKTSPNKTIQLSYGHRQSLQPIYLTINELIYLIYNYMNFININNPLRKNIIIEEGFRYRLNSNTSVTSIFKHIFIKSCEISDTDNSYKNNLKDDILHAVCKIFVDRFKYFIQLEKQKQSLSLVMKRKIDNPEHQSLAKDLITPYLSTHK